MKYLISAEETGNRHHKGSVNGEYYEAMEWRLVFYDDALDEIYEVFTYKKEKELGL